MAATRMPTAGRATAAAAFAALAFGVSLMVVPLLPASLPLDRMPLWNAGIGAVLGYRIVGLHAGSGVAESVGRGLTAGSAILVAALFVHSGARMVELALRRRYDGAMDGLAAVFELMAGYAVLVAAPAPMAAAAVGSAACGLLADAMQRRFS